MLRLRGSLRIVLAGLAALGSGTASGIGDMLVEAVRTDDQSAVLALVDGGAEPNAIAGDGSTALAWAAIRGNVQVAKLLLEAGADPNLANVYGISPLSVAIENGATGVARLLLGHGADPNLQRENGETALMTATRLDQLKVMQLLLELGADPDVCEKRFGQTALMWAGGNPEAVRLLLNHGADVQSKTQNWEVKYTIYIPTSFTLGKTGIPWNRDGEYTTRRGGQNAAFFAARKRDLTSLRMLLDAGIDVNATAADGTSLLLSALYNWVPLDGNFQPGRGAPARSGSSQRFWPNLDMAHILLDRGVSATKSDTAGYTPLHAAALAVAWVARRQDKRSDGVYRTLPALLTLDTPPNPPPFDIVAALTMMQRLLELGADPNQQTRYPTPGPNGDVRINPTVPGSSALHVAAGSGSLELVRMLLDAGADPNLSRYDGHTPFSVAVVAVDMPILEELISRGANLEARYDPHDRYPDPVKAISLPRQGQTITHIAAGNRTPRVIEYLHSKGAPINQKNAQGETPFDLADHQERFQEALDRQSTDGDPERLSKVVRSTDTTDVIRKFLDARMESAATDGP